MTFTRSEIVGLALRCARSKRAVKVNASVDALQALARFALDQDHIVEEVSRVAAEARAHGGALDPSVLEAFIAENRFVTLNKETKTDAAA